MGSTVQKKTAVSVNNTRDCYLHILCPVGHTADQPGMADARQKELYGPRKSLQFIVDGGSITLTGCSSAAAHRGSQTQRR